MDVKKTISKYFKILKLQFNSSQRVHIELLRKPNEDIRKNRTFNSPSDWKLNFEFEFPEDGPNIFDIK